MDLLSLFWFMMALSMTTFPAVLGQITSTVGAGTTTDPTTTDATPITTTTLSPTTQSVGSWGTWTSWTSCSVTCGTGTISRTRSCSGGTCSGSDTENSSCQASSYCLPSTYGNILLNCGAGKFGCATGSPHCIDFPFRCDGHSDCDDGSDENATFTGCSNTAGMLRLSVVTLCIAMVALYMA